MRLELEDRHLEAEAILNATGRVPRLDHCLEKAGIEVEGGDLKINRWTLGRFQGLETLIYNLI